ncbi:hypothetical protein RB595_008085 [Gaeumannomyces hyphopodioides]
MGDLEPTTPIIAQNHESTLTPLVEILEIPGRGKGVVAIKDIRSGTRVLCEEPLLVSECHPDPATLNNLIATKLRQMPVERRREFLSLHNNEPGGPYPLAGIFDANSIPNGDEGAVYATVCRLNHSCLPNCMTAWNTILQRQTVHAVRNIRRGEELTLQYYNAPHESRRAYLHRHFGFWCDCPTCAQPRGELALSDVRRLRIDRLFEEISDAGRVRSDPNGVLLDCRALWGLVRAEYCGAVMGIEAHACYVAAQVCQAHGDCARASKFAALACLARAACEGADSVLTAKMAAIGLDPCAELGVPDDDPAAWANPLSLVPPRGYPQALGEIWLWRQGSEGDGFDVDRYLQGRM